MTNSILRDMICYAAADVLALVRDEHDYYDYNDYNDHNHYNHYNDRNDYNADVGSKYNCADDDEMC